MSLSKNQSRQPVTGVDIGGGGGHSMEAVEKHSGATSSFQVLRSRVSATCPDDVSAFACRAIATGEPASIYVFAVNTILCAYDDPELARRINRADLILPDGMPLVWLGRRAGFRVSRCYGPDIMLRICRDGLEQGFRHFLYGGTPEVLERLTPGLHALAPGIRIVGAWSPPFRQPTEAEIEADIARINASGANVVWVCLGQPKQEYWVTRVRERLDAPVVIAVGAAFNFHAGMVPQAPRWMMRGGLEWLFRFCAEPRRLWRRYLIGNPRFVWLLLKNKLVGRIFKLEKPGR